MTAQLDALRDAIIANLDDTYELVYVDRGDELGDDQVAAIVRGDFEALWEMNWEWEADSRHAGARYEAEDEAKAIIREWERRDERDYDDLYDEFECSEQWDEVLDEIKWRDRSDPYRDLARSTGLVLCRTLIVGEDESWSFNADLTPIEVMTDAGIAPTPHNHKAIKDALVECSPEYSVLMGSLIYALDVGDIYDLPGDSDAEIEIVNPHLWIGNPFAGSGYCTDEPLEATFRIKRSELQTDKDAWGYGWDEVAGVYTRAYEAEVRPVEKKEQAA